jgi:hypothetical protein
VNRLFEAAAEIQRFFVERGVLQELRELLDLKEDLGPQGALTKLFEKHLL